MDLNKLFLDFLESHHAELTSKGSKLAYAYSKAIDKLRSYPEPITTPRQIKSIQFIGEKIFLLLCSRLKKHCLANEIAIPAAFENHVSLNEQGGQRRDELDLDTEPTKKRKTSKWVPKRRSGSWAILVALYQSNRGAGGLSKEAVIAAAGQYCDHSFTANPAARDFYSAWDGVKTLLKRELVECMGRPKSYALTELGAKMAELICQQEGIEVSFARDEPDCSFDNGVRYEGGPPLKRVEVQDIEPSSGPVLEQNVEPCPIETENGVDRVHDVANRLYSDTPYEIWPTGSFEIVLLIDSREIRSQSERDFFYNRVVSKGVKCEVRSLSVGDVLWIARNKQSNKEVVLNYVCERKRLDDLAMSIRDGRFAEQKTRLKRSGISNVYYIVEESGLGDLQRIMEMKQSIETAISTIVTTSRFFVQRFRRTDDTIDWLVAMTSIMEKRYACRQLMVIKPQSINNQEEYLRILSEFREKFESGSKLSSNDCSPIYECVHQFHMYQATLVKSNMMTVKDMFLLMLMSVRGISFEKAIMIQQKFQTPKRLIEFYRSHSEEPELLMATVFASAIGNKKINKAASTAMFEAWGKVD